jgi:hypothetical protein
MVSSHNHFVHLADGVALAALAARAMTPKGMDDTRSSLGEMPAAQVCLGRQIPVDKPAPRLYTRTTAPIFGGSSHLGLRRVDMGEPASSSHLY